MDLTTQAKKSLLRALKNRVASHRGFNGLIPEDDYRVIILMMEKYTK